MTTSDLGVFPPLLPTESFPLPAKCDLDGSGGLTVPAGSLSVLISVFGTELRKSYASVRASKLRET